MGFTKNILVFVSYLGSGGAEKHTVRLVNALNQEKYTITVVTPNKVGSYEKEINKDIPVVRIGSKHAFKLSAVAARLTCVLPLKKLIGKIQPDLVITVTEVHTLVYLLATQGLDHQPRHIALIQNTISQAHGSSRLTDRLIMKGIARWYNRIDHIVALSSGVADDLKNLFPAISTGVSIIHNIGIDQTIQKSKKVDEPLGEGPFIVTCGRFVPQKGYTYLLQAFAKFLQSSNGTLLILGDGVLKPVIKNQIQQLKLQNYVRLLGFKDNPYAYMAQADMFVLSSIYEGFGNVLVEAMACGVPVISTDCPHGPSEIIDHEVNGLLVPVRQPDALANAMHRLMDSPSLQKSLASNGLKRADDFSAEKIALQYESLIDTILS